MGPGPRPILYSLLRSPDLALLCRQNLGKNFWAPLRQILDPLLLLQLSHEQSDTAICMDNNNVSQKCDDMMTIVGMYFSREELF